MYILLVQIEEGNLRISGVQESDAGTYTCVASNGVGTVEDQVTLSIGSAPSVLQPPVGKGQLMWSSGKRSECEE